MIVRDEYATNEWVLGAVGRHAQEQFMMELAHSLLLNEAALQQVADPKKPIFIYEWLRFLEKVLGAAQKSDIKECQPKLVTQLLSQVRDQWLLSFFPLS